MYLVIKISKAWLKDSSDHEITIIMNGEGPEELALVQLMLEIIVK